LTFGGHNDISKTFKIWDTILKISLSGTRELPDKSRERERERERKREKK